MSRLKIDPERFLFDQFVMGPEEIRKYLSRGIRHPLRTNTDDLLITEYSTPRDMLRRRSVEYFVELDQDEFSSESLLRLTSGLDVERIREYR